MHATMIEYTQFSQEMNAYATVLDSLVRSVQKEMNTKAAINEDCKMMDMLITMATILNKLLDENNDAEKVIRFPVEFDRNIGLVKQHLLENFSSILEDLGKRQPLLFHWYGHNKRIKKTQTAQASFEKLFNRIETMISYDEWDEQMHQDAENGVFDKLIEEANSDYDKGKIHFK